jgi:arylsulfatase A-like enzyme
MVSVLDIFPTVLAQIDAPWADRFTQQTTGVNVLAADYQERPLFAQRTGRNCGDGSAMNLYALTTREWKYIHDPVDGHKLFNRIEDPHELGNVIDAHPDIAKALHDRLEELGGYLVKRGKAFGEAESVTGAVDPEALQKALHDLGYLQGGASQPSGAETGD